MMLHILYFANNLADPAIRRRVLMMRTGGARVTIAGFSRNDGQVGKIEGIEPILLGASRDGKFFQRAMAVGAAALKINRKLRKCVRPDVIVARNIEMLALAARARAIFKGTPIPIVYECLDIHRLQLRTDFVGAALRRIEQRLLLQTNLLVTSSPAFVDRYFNNNRQLHVPVELVENKLLELGSGRFEIPSPQLHMPGEPWRIGWFGTLRCRRSLGILSTASRHQSGRIEVILRGRPALREHRDFHRSVDAEPHLCFKGPYRNPEDIGDIYRHVHFAWLIDLFEEGQNSNWLLPNRLYEGCRFGAVPIALAGTQTACFLHQHGIGIVLPEASPTCLERALNGLTQERYSKLRQNVTSLALKTWVYDSDSCTAFVDTLRELRNLPGHSLDEVPA